MTDDVKVTDEEITDYYDKNKPQYARRRSRRAATSATSSSRRRRWPTDLYAQLQSERRNFAALAKKYSTDPGSKNGRQAHRHGVKGRLVPEFDKVAFALKDERDLEAGQDAVRLAHHPGARADQGRDAAKTTPLAQVKEAIRQQLLQQKKQQAMDKWVAGDQEGLREKIGYQIGYAPRRPGSLRAASRRPRTHHDRVARWRSPTRSSSSRS